MTHVEERMKSKLVHVVCLALVIVLQTTSAQNVTTPLTTAAKINSPDTTAATTELPDTGRVRGDTVPSSPGDLKANSLPNATARLKGGNTTRCRLKPTDPELHKNLWAILNAKTKLVEYHIEIDGYENNPLLENMTTNYRNNIWQRASSRHGRTLLSLAFNYDILSMKMLSFGVETLAVLLQDEPKGCIGGLPEDEKIDVLMEILLLDLQVTGPSTLRESDQVCHQIMKDNSGYAHFIYRCCDQSGVCVDNHEDPWVMVLNILLIILKVAVFIYGPMMIPDWVYNPVLENVPYVVKLAEGLPLKLYITNSRSPPVQAKQTLYAADLMHFKNFKQKIKHLKRDQVLKGKMQKYHLNISYRRLLSEHKVPVGFFLSIFNMICMCKIRHLDGFKECCGSRVLGPPQNKSKALRWITPCKWIGKILILLLIPLPFYIRLVFYYFHEEREMLQRRALITKEGLMEPFNINLLQYFTPTHPFFIIIYIIYFLITIVLGILNAMGSGWFNRLIRDPYRDLKKVSYLSGVSMLFQIILWPFTRFGIAGIFVGILWWPFGLLVAIGVLLFYCVPVIYLTFRVLVHSKDTHKDATSEAADAQPLIKGKKKIGESLTSFLNQQKQSISLPKPFRDDDEEDDEDDGKFKRVALQFLFGTVCVLALYAILLIIAECAAFGVEVCVFTVMGVIVNAGATLRYVSLIFLVLLYSHDCFNVVYKTYVSLNKATFGLVKDKVGGRLFDVTSLPSTLQQNEGFKSTNVAKAHETKDCLAPFKPKTLEVNDLLLFLDKWDRPRIPRHLFEDMCTIEVDGAPGPVYKQILGALGKFLTIILFLVFVLLVVLAFGNIYKISSTNQMLATLAGGMIPFILRNFMNPASSSVDTSSMSFKAKADEILDLFKQTWTMQDLDFELDDPPKPPEGEGGDQEKIPLDQADQAFTRTQDQVNITGISQLESGSTRVDICDSEDEVDILIQLLAPKPLERLKRLGGERWVSLSQFQYQPTADEEPRDDGLKEQGIADIRV